MPVSPSAQVAHTSLSIRVQQPSMSVCSIAIAPLSTSEMVIGDRSAVGRSAGTGKSLWDPELLPTEQEMAAQPTSSALFTPSASVWRRLRFYLRLAVKSGS